MALRLGVGHGWFLSERVRRAQRPIYFWLFRRKKSIVNGAEQDASQNNESVRRQRASGGRYSRVQVDSPSFGPGSTWSHRSAINANQSFAGEPASFPPAVILMLSKLLAALEVSLSRQFIRLNKRQPLTSVSQFLWIMVSTGGKDRVPNIYQRSSKRVL